jgi:polysaccharide biosynthesis transport protein
MDNSYNIPAYSQNSFREFVFVVFYNKRLAIMTTSVFFFLSILLALFMPSIYSSSAKVIVSSSLNQLDPLQQDRDYDLKNKMVRILQNQKEIIYSYPVLSKAASVINADATPEGIEEIVENLKKYVKVTPPKGESFEGSNVFYITYENKNPEKARDVTEALADAYLMSSTTFSLSKAEYSYEFFRKQVGQLQDEMQRRANKLREYEATNAAALIDILNLESGKANMEVGARALLAEANRNKQKLQGDMVGVKLQIENLEAALNESELPAILPEMEVAGRAISSYRNKIVQLQLQINEMSTQFTAGYDPYKALAKELGLTVKLLREEINSYIKSKRVELATIAGKIAEYNNQIAHYEASISETAQQRSTYEALKQEYTLASRAYEQAVSKMEQAHMASALNQDVQNITIVEHPQLPFKPVKPNRILLVVVGLLGGIMFGVAVALVVDFFDHTIKSPADIERWLDVPVLGSVDRVTS